MKSETGKARILSAKSRRRSLNGRTARSTTSLTVPPADLATLTLQWPSSDANRDMAPIHQQLRHFIASVSNWQHYFTRGFKETAQALSAGRLCAVIVAADAPLVAARFLLPLAALRHCPVVRVGRLFTALQIHVLGVLAAAATDENTAAAGTCVDDRQRLMEMLTAVSSVYRLPGQRLPAVNADHSGGDSAVVDQVLAPEESAESQLDETEGHLENDDDGECQSDADGDFLAADFISLSSVKRQKSTTVGANSTSRSCGDGTRAHKETSTAGGFFMDTSGRRRKRHQRVDRPS